MADLRSLLKEISPRRADSLARLLEPPSGGADLPLSARLDRLVGLTHWVTGEGRAGLEELVAVLRASPDHAAFLADVIRSVLRETHCRTLFAETGLPRQFRFFAELGSRIVRGVLPDPPDDDDLAELLERLFPSRSDAEFLSALPLALVEELLGTLFPNGEEPFAPVREEMADALRILSVWASGLGLSADFRLRAGNRANPIASGGIFLRLPESVAAAAHMSRGKGSLAGERRSVKLAALADVEACRAVIVEVRRHLEEFGVSADLVFRIWTLEKLLERLETLLDQLLPEEGANVTRTGIALLTTLVREGVRDRSVRDLLRTSSQLLARKVIERVGESAEHYITSSRAEYFEMLRSAAGGGLLTTGTAMLKVFITSLKLPLFQEGLLASVNYAGSFLAMQFAGFTLATKQSSVTAAKLAGSIKVLGGELDPSPIVAEIARVTRSQLAAIAGNLGMVIPGALLADFLVKSLTGHSYLNAEQAEYVLHSLDPFHTLTVFYAILTGVVLWSSSLAAGWLENWSAYRRIPEALASHRGIVKRLGALRAARLSRWFAHNVSGLGGNLSIGLLLGMLPVFGKFLGLPIDVRHVTLSTGQLAFAAGHLGRAELTSPEMLVAAFGILLIALCNFGVSFALALGVAMRARGVLLGETAGLLEALLIELVRNPRAFLLPPRKDEETSVRPPDGAESTG